MSMPRISAVTPTQGDLFSPPFQAHSETSRAAAEAIKPTAQTQRERVYALLRSRDATDEEIASFLNMNPSTARPRRIELQKDGRIIQIGTKRTTSGRLAAVWHAIPERAR